jgi:hypothetical protein
MVEFPGRFDLDPMDDWYGVVDELTERVPQREGEKVNYVIACGLAIELALQGEVPGYKTKDSFKQILPREHHDIDLILINDGINDEIVDFGREKGILIERKSPGDQYPGTGISLGSKEEILRETCTVKYNGKEFLIPSLEFLVVGKTSSFNPRGKDEEDVEHILSKYKLSVEKFVELHAKHSHFLPYLDHVIGKYETKCDKLIHILTDEFGEEFEKELKKYGFKKNLVKEMKRLERKKRIKRFFRRILVNFLF